MDSAGHIDGVGCGAVFQAQYGSGLSPGWVWAPYARGRGWRADGEEFHTVFAHLAFTAHPKRVLALWPFIAGSALLLGAAAYLDARARRRIRTGFCRKCDYDCRGLPGGTAARCPECGAQPGGG
jgi:hypothetical protein